MRIDAPKPKGVKRPSSLAAEDFPECESAQGSLVSLPILHQGTHSGQGKIRDKPRHPNQYDWA
jgi:hypothetical protein